MSNHFNNKLTHACNKIMSQKIESDQHYATANRCSKITMFLEQGDLRESHLLNCSKSQRQFNIISYQIYIKIVVQIQRYKCNILYLKYYKFLYFSLCQHMIIV